MFLSDIIINRYAFYSITPPYISLLPKLYVQISQFLSFNPYGSKQKAMHGVRTSYGTVFLDAQSYLG
jgi:hypothetical protein